MVLTGGRSMTNGGRCRVPWAAPAWVESSDGGEALAAVLVVDGAGAGAAHRISYICGPLMADEITVWLRWCRCAVWDGFLGIHTVRCIHRVKLESR